jgi:hypothetical protein
MKRQFTRQSVIFASLLVLSIASVDGQTAKAASDADSPYKLKAPSGKPAPRTADGKPDLSGVWGGPSDGPQHIGRDIPGHVLPYTPAGAAAYQDNINKNIDPSALCILQGVPRAILSGQPFEIFQKSNRVAVLYERDTSWKIIPVDGRQHPKDPEPSYFGDAVGSWDGDVFVIDSTGFKGTKIWADETAHPQSDALHLIERWTRPDVDHLVDNVTIDDPKYYAKPVTFKRTFRLLPYELIEQACAENNLDRDHIGAGLGTKDGTRGYTKNNPSLSAAPKQ